MFLTFKIHCFFLILVGTLFMLFVIKPIIITDLVLDAMKNVKLEPNAIPEWAKNLSEENWKEVLGKLQNIKS